MPLFISKCLFYRNRLLLIALKYFFSSFLQFSGKTVCTCVGSAANVNYPIDIAIHRIGKHLIEMLCPGDKIVIKWVQPQFMDLHLALQ